MSRRFESVRAVEENTTATQHRTTQTSRTMGPKSKKGAANDRQRSAEEEVEDPLQAVVSAAAERNLCCVILSSPQILADPFETRFNPFTLERPRVLLPCHLQQFLDILTSIRASVCSLLRTPR